MKALLIFLFLSTSAIACLHYDKSFAAAIQEGTKQALMFHDGRSAHLIVKTELTATKGKLPKRVAWVMPFPALPEKYEEVDSKIFDEMERYIISANPVKQTRGDAPNMWNPKSARGGIKVHETKIVGNYQIHPIEILSLDSGKEFNDWLSKNKFNPMPLELQKAYLKKGAVFLAIEANFNDKKAGLKPIHIVYPSTELSFPLKFTHDTRTFNLDLYVLTAKELQPLVDTPPMLDFLHSVKLEKLNKDHTPQMAAMFGNQTGYLTRFLGWDINSKGKPLAELAQDPKFTP